MEPTTPDMQNIEPRPQEEMPRDEALSQEGADGKKKKKKTREGAHWTLVRILVAILILALGIFLILFFVAKASHFDSIGSMLQHMFIELGLMWQRINA